MAADQSVITGASFLAAPAIGTPHAVLAKPLTYFGAQGGSYAVLTTGNAGLVDDPGELSSFGLNGGNVRGNSDYDVTVLKIDLDVPAGVNYLAFDLQFLTEEYPGFSAEYADTFVAELDGTTWTTSGGMVSAPNNFAVFSDGSLVNSAAAGLRPANAGGPAYDGGTTSGGDVAGAGTKLLRAATPITPGTHTLYLSIFDQGDKLQDSAVLIQNLQLGTSATAVSAGVTSVGQVTAGTTRNWFDAYTEVLIFGQATDLAAPLANVTVGGRPVEVIDAGGNYFTRVTAMPGTNSFEVVAIDVLGNTYRSDEPVTFEAVVRDPSVIEYEILEDVSASILGEYGQTSLHEQPDVLFADVAVHNNGGYTIRPPLLVGVINVSEPTVTVRGFDGITPGGIPYYDFTGQIAAGDLNGDGSLSPDETTGTGTIEFYNPDRIPFTYDLVVLGRLNKYPRFITPPVVQVIAGEEYAYDSEAHDEDGDPLSYSLLSRPKSRTGYPLATDPVPEMQINPSTGELTWQTTTQDVGNHVVAVRVEDGKGGFDEQRFLLSVIEKPANRPPYFTTTAPTAAYVNVQ